MSIEVLTAGQASEYCDALASVLVDCVTGGSSTSFMLPFEGRQATAWWAGVFGDVRAGRTVLFDAFLDGELVGSVQLGLDMPPNQPHRGDVKKLVVHRRALARGVGAALMSALEGEARRRRLTLLVLDAAGEEAENSTVVSAGMRLGPYPTTPCC